MPYNKENLLRKIIEIQDIVLEHKQKDVPQTVIYRKYIAERYHISYSCFNNYLSVPAKTELKNLISKREQQKKNEPELFD